MNWNVIEGESLASLVSMPSEHFDALITDPPYSSGGTMRSDRTGDPARKYLQSGQAKTYPTFSGDNRDGRSFEMWATLWLCECHRVLKTGGYALVFTDWRMLPTVTDAFQAGGFNWRGLIAWDKTEGSRAPHKGYFRHQCEYIVWGTKGPLAVPNPKDKTHPGPFPGCVRVGVKQAEKQHMTGKPVELIERLCAAVAAANPHSVVLDPFCGSGTTGVGALKNGLGFTGIEMSRHYAQVSRARLEATAQQCEEKS